jgi:hypothetical protein
MRRHVATQCAHRQRPAAPTACALSDLACVANGLGAYRAAPSARQSVGVGKRCFDGSPDGEGAISLRALYARPRLHGTFAGRLPTMLSCLLGRQRRRVLPTAPSGRCSPWTGAPKVPTPASAPQSLTGPQPPARDFSRSNLLPGRSRRPPVRAFAPTRQPHRCLLGLGP